MNCGQRRNRILAYYERLPSMIYLVLSVASLWTVVIVRMITGLSPVDSELFSLAAIFGAACGMLYLVRQYKPYLWRWLLCSVQWMALFFVCTFPPEQAISQTWRFVLSVVATLSLIYSYNPIDPPRSQRGGYIEIDDPPSHSC